MSHDREEPSESVGWHPGLIVGLFLACVLVFGGIPLICCGPLIFSPGFRGIRQTVEDPTDTKPARNATEPARSTDRDGHR